MATAFDPYHVWLGIPPTEQTRDHYRLLGLPRFADDAAVIERAAERQLDILREKLQSPQRDLAAQLIAEVQQARLILLDPQTKAEYDAMLRGSLSGEVSAARRLGEEPPAGKTALSAPTARRWMNIFAAVAAPLLFLWRHPSFTTALALLIICGTVAYVLLDQPGEQLQSAQDSAASVATEALGATAKEDQATNSATSPEANQIAAQRGAGTAPASSPTNPAAAGGQGRGGSTSAKPGVGSQPGSRPAAAAGTAPTANVPAGTSPAATNPVPLRPGLIGRIKVSGEDLGVILRYLPGEQFSQADLTRLISQYGLTPGEQEIELHGILRVHCPAGQAALPVHLQMTGDPGRVTGWTVSIDGRPLRVPADPQAGTINISLALHEGDHPIVYRFKGADVGSKFALRVRALSGVAPGGAPPGNAGSPNAGAQPTGPTGHATNLPGGIAEAAPPAGGTSGSPAVPLVEIGYSEELLARVSELPTLGRHVLNSSLATLTAEDLAGKGVAEPQSPTSAEPGTTPGAAVSSQRKAVPPEAALVQARNEIREKYRKDYQAAVAPAAKRLLARTLLQSGNTESDSARQYALYDEAKSLAVAAGDPDLAIQAGEALGLAFDVDPWSFHLAVVSDLAKTARTVEVRENLLGALEPLVQSAVAEDRYDVAEALVQQAIDLAGQLRDTVRRDELSQRRDEIKRIALAYAEVKSYLETLAKDPDNPQANEAVGRFYCFVKQEWKKGLPHLTKGETVILRTVAQNEVNQPSTPTTQFQLAEDWWAFAEALPQAEKAAVRRHAGYWYLQCESRLTGEAAEKARTRLAESGRLVDLVGVAAARRATLLGTWQIGSKMLLSAPEPLAQISFSIVPPPEYDLILELQPIPLPPPQAPRGQTPRPNPALELGRGAFAIGLVQGRHRFVTVLDYRIPNQGTYCFLADYDHRGPDPANPTFQQAAVFRSQRSNLIICAVRKTGLTVTANGMPIIRFGGDFAQLSMPPGWAKTGHPRIFFATRFAVYRITRAELRDIGE